MPHKRQPRQFVSREERRRTVLPARVRDDAGWSDACILNLSSGGLMIYSKCAPKPGSHIELRRGGELVIARVVWRKNHRIGLCSRDPLSIETIISGETAAAASAPFYAAGRQVERRRQPRHSDQSRARARAAEFLSLVLFGTILAGAGAAYVQKALATPVAAVEAALGPR